MNYSEIYAKHRLKVEYEHEMSKLIAVNYYKKTTPLPTFDEWIKTINEEPRFPKI